ncbi:MAG: 3',5'-cyclic-nucleotide phosphodiesterase [Sulfuriferula sp.]|nr:3',5'-cyclic-nucleotide phosphodiesterase [Sulfuriferula sp.]
MRLQILGCSGGVGGTRHTTAMLIDNDILIDAGSGVLSLSLEQLTLIDHVFITHSHLDHILALPLLLDSVGAMRDRPVTVYAIDAVLEILRTDIFNWRIWPDFTEVPPANPYLRFSAIEVYETVQLGERGITALPANHTVPAVGYQLSSQTSSVVFSGDTAQNPALWHYINQIAVLHALIIETAFPQDEHGIAEIAKHLSPVSLLQELTQYQQQAPIYITHLKPGRETLILDEIVALNTQFHSIKPLQQGHVFEF